MTHKPVYRPGRIDDESNPPMWYLWPVSCPMLEQKIADGHPRDMACQGGTLSKDGSRQLFTSCWHSPLGAFDELKVAGDTVVCCNFNPEIDLWNRPNGRVDPTAFEPQILPPIE